MMNLRKVKVGIIVGILSLVIFTTGVMAGSKVQDISAQIDYSMKMVVDGKEFNPEDSNGSALRPILYNNRTYLPVRALGSALGKAVDWDEATNSVIIGTKSDKKWMLDLSCTATDGASVTKDPELLYTPKGSFEQGVYLKGQYSFNLTCKAEGKYSKFYGKVYMKSTGRTIKVRDGQGGSVLKEFEVKAGEVKEFEVDVVGVDTIVLETKWEGYTGKFDIFVGDAYLK